jgi:hypothetical protein
VDVKIPEGMGKRKQASKAYGKYTHYWRKEMMSTPTWT